MLWTLLVELGQCFEQSVLKQIQFGAYFAGEVLARGIRRSVLQVPLVEQVVLPELVGFYLIGKEQFGTVSAQSMCIGCLADFFQNLLLARAVLNRLATIPFMQRHSLGDFQSLLDAVEQGIEEGAGLVGIYASGQPCDAGEGDK